MQQFQWRPGVLCAGLPQSSYLPGLQAQSFASELPFRKGPTGSQKELDHESQRATTPINIPELSRQLSGHPNKPFVDTLITGLTLGFDTGFQSLPSTPIQCKNLLSARKDPVAVSELIQKELDKGFLIGPYDSVPFLNFRINPLGLAEHKYSMKKRLIVDLSSPHGDKDIPSLNSLINKEDYSLQYVKVDDAIRLIAKLGQGAWLMKTDISDAFKLLPIKPELWPYHGISWDNKFYFFVRLVFGSRSSPKIFDTLSEAICWIAKHKYGLDYIFHLLDDFLVVEPPHGDANSAMARLLTVFRLLNVPLALHKTQGPCTELEYLGVILDSRNMEARLPSDKIARIGTILDSFVHKKSVTKRELLSILGHMNFASRVILPGRSFVSRLITLSTTASQLHHHLALTAAVRADLAMWSLFLKRWNGVSFFIDEGVLLATDMAIYTDATPSAFGGFYRTRWFQGTFPPAILQEQPSMALFELYPIVMVVFSGAMSGVVNASCFIVTIKLRSTLSIKVVPNVVVL